MQKTKFYTFGLNKKTNNFVGFTIYLFFSKWKVKPTKLFVFLLTHVLLPCKALNEIHFQLFDG